MQFVLTLSCTVLNSVCVFFLHLDSEHSDSIHALRASCPIHPQWIHYLWTSVDLPTSLSLRMSRGMVTCPEGFKNIGCCYRETLRAFLKILAGEYSYWATFDLRPVILHSCKVPSFGKGPCGVVREEVGATCLVIQSSQINPGDQWGYMSQPDRLNIL